MALGSNSSLAPTVWHQESYLTSLSNYFTCNSYVTRLACRLEYLYVSIYLEYSTLLLLKVWLTNWQHQYPLGSCWKYRLSDPTEFGICILTTPKWLEYVLLFEKPCSVLCFEKLWSTQFPSFTRSSEFLQCARPQLCWHLLHEALHSPSCRVLSVAAFRPPWCCHLFLSVLLTVVSFISNTVSGTLNVLNKYLQNTRMFLVLGQLLRLAEERNGSCHSGTLNIGRRQTWSRPWYHESHGCWGCSEDGSRDSFLRMGVA